MMHGDMEEPSDPGSLTLIGRRTINASPGFLFDAWTQPNHLKRWWGPSGVKCIEAQIDLRVGGSYRIANLFPDGRILWICGEYKHVERPAKLVYTWRVEPNESAAEIVTVEFVAKGVQTEIIVTHERIPNSQVRDRHGICWNGCLNGLDLHVRTFAAVTFQASTEQFPAQQPES